VARVRDLLDEDDDLHARSLSPESPALSAVPRRPKPGSSRRTRPTRPRPGSDP
jgi:hypothetical protein